MAALPYLIAVVSAWAVIATILAVVRGRKLARERQDHASAQDTIGRFRAAVTHLKEKAADSASQLEALQREHQSLKLQVEAQKPEAVEQPIPMIMIDSLDISAEVGTLFEHVARVAKAIRDYSAFTRGHLAPEPSRARYDLHWLSDSLHSLDTVGKALANGSVKALNTACRDLLAMYDAYLKDASGYNSRDTFQRLSGKVPLAEVSSAVKSIAIKATPRHDGTPDPALELERMV
jgi:hypothetical protein